MTDLTGQPVAVNNRPTSENGTADAWLRCSRRSKAYSRRASAGSTGKVRRLPPRRGPGSRPGGGDQRQAGHPCTWGFVPEGGADPNKVVFAGWDEFLLNVKRATRSNGHRDGGAAPPSRRQRNASRGEAQTNQQRARQARTGGESRKSQAANPESRLTGSRPKRKGPNRYWWVRPSLIPGHHHPPAPNSAGCSVRSPIARRRRGGGGGMPAAVVGCRWRRWQPTGGGGGMPAGGGGGGQPGGGGGGQPGGGGGQPGRSAARQPATGGTRGARRPGRPTRVSHHLGGQRRAGAESCRGRPRGCAWEAPRRRRQA